MLCPKPTYLKAQAALQAGDLENIWSFDDASRFSCEAAHEKQKGYTNPWTRSTEV